MENPFVYPGKGEALRKVSAATGNALVEPETATIPAGGHTEVFAAHDCLEILFEAVYAAAATGNFTVRKMTDGVATAGETFDSDAIAGVLTHNWNAGEALIGHFQIFNDSDQAATIYLQKRIN